MPSGRSSRTAGDAGLGNDSRPRKRRRKNADKHNSKAKHWDWRSGLPIPEDTDGFLFEPKHAGKVKYNKFHFLCSRGEFLCVVDNIFVLLS